MINEILHISTSTLAMSSNDMEALARMLVQSAKGGSYGLATGLGLTLMVHLASRLNLLNWVKPEGKKWVAMGIATLGAVGAGLVGQVDWLEIVVSSLSVALTSVGGWEFIGSVTGGKKPGDPNDRPS
jgi:hypothetical protein